MKIKKLILNNFRGYDHAEIEFNDFNCIVGKNDVGKSTIFEALSWFFDKGKGYVSSDFNYRSFVYVTDKSFYYDEETNTDYEEEYETNELYDGDTLSVEVHFSKLDNIEEALDYEYGGVCPFSINMSDFLDEHGDYCIKKEVVNVNSYQFNRDYDEESEPTYWIKSRCFENEKIPISFFYTDKLYSCYKSIADDNDDILLSISNLKQNKWQNRTKVEEYERIMADVYRNFCVNHHSFKYRYVCLERLGFDITLLFPKFRCFTPENFGLEADKVIQSYFCEKIGSILKTEVISKHIAKVFEKISQSLKSNGLVGDVEFQPKVKFNWSDMLNISLCIVDGKNVIPWQNRGDGIRRIVLNTFFRMIANEQDGYNQIFAFDEPETGLHPSAQTDFLESLKNLSNIYHQVFIATHSPTIVSQCKPDEIIHIKKDENGFSKVYQNDDTSLKEVVEDLGICSNNLLLSLFGTAKCLFLVEGPDDVLAFEYLCTKYKEMGKVENTFKEMGCAIIPSGGCDSIKHWSTFKVIEQIGKPFYIVLDSDKENSTMDSPNYKKLQEAYPNRTDCFQVLRKREIENYIPSSYFNSLMPSIAISYGDWDDVKEICKRHSDSIRLKGKKVCEGHFRYLTYEQLRSTFCPDGQDEHDEFLEIYEKIKSLCNG